MNGLGSLEKILADVLFGIGTIDFKPRKLKGHENHPDAPLSLIYINLRTPDNPQPGPLDTKSLELIGACLHKKILQQNFIFSAIAGIPRAGEPLVEGLIKNIPEPRGFRLVKLDKEEKDGARRIIPKKGQEYRSGDIVLLIDDVLTEGDSKLEAIGALESQGVKVRDILVVVDREQGGRQELEQLGYNVHAVFLVSNLLKYYLETRKIGQEKYNQVMAYLFPET